MVATDQNRRSTDLSNWGWIMWTFRMFLVMLAFFVVSVCVGFTAGYWVAKNERAILATKQEPVSAPDCGSCRKGGNK